MTFNEHGFAFPQHGWSKDPEVAARMADKGGMTMRDWFASRAPEAIPYWFEPSMPTPRPDPQFVDRDGQPTGDVCDPRTFVPNAMANAAAINEWDIEQQRQRLAQWPWAYADLVLSARAGGANATAT